MRRTNYLGLGVGYRLGEHPGREDDDLVRVTLDYVALHAFATDARTTGGLVYGWLGGNIADEFGAYMQVPGGTVAVAPSTVTYVERTNVGAVTTNTTGWTTGKYPMARVTTDAVGITNVEDYRPAVLPGVQGPAGPQGPKGDQGPAGPALPADPSWVGAQYCLVRKPSTLQPPAMSASSHTDAGFGVGNGTTVLFPIRRTASSTVSDWGGTWPVYTKPRTNLIPRSQEFDNAAWLKQVGGIASAPVVTANAGVAPDGTTTADRVVFALNGATDSSYSILAWPSVGYSSGVADTVSIWARTEDSSTKTMRLLHGDGNGTLITVTGTWQRFAFTRTPTTTAGVGVVQLRLRGIDGTSDSATIMVWGAQIERGATATRYIPTTSAAVTVTPDYAGADWEPVLDFMAAPSLFLEDWQGKRQIYSVARTNRVIRSEPTIAQLYSKSGTVTDSTAPSPFAGNAIQFPAAVQQDWAYVFGATGVVNPVLSVFVRMDDGSAPVLGGGASADFHLYVNGGANVANTGYAAVHLGGGLYRVSGKWTGTTNAVGVGVFRLASHSGRGFKIVGFQVEADNGTGLPTRYIATTDAAVTVTDYTLGRNGGVTMAVPPASGAVLSWTGDAPSYAPGPVFIVPAGAVGAWSGQADKLARWTGSAWTFETPTTARGVFAFDLGRWLRWSGTAWVSVATQTLTWTWPQDGWSPGTPQPPVRIDQPGRILAVRHYRDNTTPPSMSGTAQLRVNGSNACTINVAGGDANRTWITDTVTAPTLAAGDTLQPVVTASGTGVGDITVQVDIEKP